MIPRFGFNLLATSLQVGASYSLCTHQEAYTKTIKSLEECCLVDSREQPVKYSMYFLFSALSSAEMSSQDYSDFIKTSSAPCIMLEKYLSIFLEVIGPWVSILYKYLSPCSLKYKMTGAGNLWTPINSMSFEYGYSPTLEQVNNIPGWLLVTAETASKALEDQFWSPSNSINVGLWALNIASACSLWKMWMFDSPKGIANIRQVTTNRSLYV